MDIWRWGVTVCAEAAGTQTQTQVGCFLSATKATVERESCLFVLRFSNRYKLCICAAEDV